VSLDYGIIQYNYMDQKASHDLEQRKVG